MTKVTTGKDRQIKRLAAVFVCMLLGLIEEGALADILLVNGNPVEDLTLFHDPEKNLAVIMKDGKIYKNIIN